MAVNNIYIELTRAFNRGKIRAVICSGQAAVLHQLEELLDAHRQMVKRAEGVLPFSPLGEKP